jgi:hypothetical protein
MTVVTQKQLVEFLRGLADSIEKSEVKEIEFTDWEINRDQSQVADQSVIDDEGKHWAIWELTGRETVKFTLFVEYVKKGGD